MALIMAHRGFSSLYPENTMLAFQKALEAGAESIELDVQFTKDERLVVFHDYTVDEWTNGTGKVNELTLLEVQALHITKNLEQTDGIRQNIPSLNEYFIWAKSNKVITNIEIKTATSADEGLEKAVLKRVKEIGLEKQVMITSFHLEHLKRVKELNSQIKTGWILKEWDPELLTQAKEQGVNYLNFPYDILTKEISDQINNKGFGLRTRVNQPDEIKQVSIFTPHAIHTDYPDWVYKILREGVEA